MREYPVRCGAVTLSVRDHGGGGPALVACHGLASNARWWDLVAEHLGDRARLIAVDLRGHGGSDRPATGYSFAEVGADLRALVTQLELGRHAVAGHSWGASVALWHAADLADRVSACICVDGGFGNLRAFFGDSWETASERMRPPQLQGVTPARLREWVGMSRLAEGSDAETAAEILSGNFEDAGDGTLRPRLDVDRHMQIAEHLYHLDSTELTGRVRCPVLLLPAAQRRAEREETAAAALASLPQGSHLQWIDGEHDLPVQRPREVADAIAAFLAGLAERPLPEAS